MSETEYKKIPIEEKYTDSNEQQPIKYGYGVRHVQALIFFICMCFGFLSSAHLGVTIVAMTLVKHEANESIDIAELVNVEVNSTIILNSTNAEVKSELTPIKNINGNITSVDNDIDHWDIYKTYDWPKSTQEMVLGSFFFGCSIMMFPIGLICQRWGGKIPIQFSMLVNGVTSIVVPWLVTWGGWKILCFLRILQGISQAGMYPGMNTLLSNWVPVSERSTLSTYVFTGSNIGCVMGFQLAGILGFSRFGWPSTFWVIGVACLLGFILITVFGAATPKDHKSITNAEKMYIMGSAENCVEIKAKVPWKSVLTSVHVWATFTTHIGHSMCFMFVFMQVSTYMFAIFKLNVISSGMLSSLPYLVSCFSSLIIGYLSDFLTNRNILSLKTARRIFNSIASVIPALCLILVIYTTDTVLAVTCFIVFMATSTAMYSGWMVNYMDLSPNFSGAIMATGNTLTNIFLFIIPFIVSNIVTDVTNRHQWRIMFFLMAAIAFGSNIIFVLFMSADVQPWNNEDNDLMEKNFSQTQLKHEAKMLESRNAKPAE